MSADQNDRDSGGRRDVSSTGETISDGVVRVLEQSGVGTIFTLSGNQTISFLAAAEKRLRIVHTRHEAAAVHMADAWGRLTESPGIAVVSGGPAFGNTVTGLLTAYTAESPLVLISARASRVGPGRREFQDFGHAAAGAPFAKRSQAARDPDSVLDVVGSALRMSVAGRPGPVHVSIPADFFDLEVAAGDGEDRTSNDQPVASPQEVADAVEAIFEFLQAATRPVIIGGPAMMRPSSAAALADLSRAIGVPVIVTENPRGLNDPALGAVNTVLPSADAVVLLGKRLDWTLDHADEGSFAPDSRFLQVDADQAELDVTAELLPADRLVNLILGDPLQIAKAVTEASDQASVDPEWHEKVASAAAQRPARHDPPAGSAGGPLHAADVCAAIQPWLDDATLICDGGEFGQWAQSLLSAPRRIINGPGGAIGASIPFSVAARLTHPDAPVVAVLGDGSMGFHPFEFDTAVRAGAPFVAIVGNDARWNSESNLHHRRFGAQGGRLYDLLPTRYDRVLSALGGYGETVTTLDQIGPAIERARASGVPACINVPIASVPAPSAFDVANEHQGGPGGATSPRD